jgi:3-dehydro-L-gulonate 2-dehydrogenase
MLDILATILSGGLSTAQISKLPAEHSVSQVFITIDISKLKNFPAIEKTIQQILDDYHTSTPTEKTKKVRYPGENMNSIREKNLKEGIPVLKKVWNEIQSIRS